MSDDLSPLTSKDVDKDELRELLNLVEHADIRDAEVDGDTAIIHYAAPVGECPACGAQTRGTTAWNSAHDRKFSCPDASCAVEKHTNQIRHENDA